ncbi:hypothetical protein BDY17DRAFT_243217 [Neohortaea acidophila]|uniref:Mitochondrial zinc maintenance protein 1, mitochondrial n=1 Tax=Neohortaea acidophila TaxID=245834 RepID=A0A6A6Q8Q5_9PEZI|nr:uncharacterized protein BDY17DRAFT_243217 [Neohortaea acidophila]KAF2488023.1 hypothetical protein BDY17DRAFT_243217 [Neohortaea acidophila]
MQSLLYLSAAEKMANRTFVLATYRHLLRATRIAFRDDEPTLTASRHYARDQFRKDGRLASGSTEAGQCVEHAQDVTKILRENVVQGKKKGDNTYKLNMHEDTQRLDNHTATTLKGTTKTFKDIKNATF